jgi:hypothetical protein
MRAPIAAAFLRLIFDGTTKFALHCGAHGAHTRTVIVQHADPIDDDTPVTPGRIGSDSRSTHAPCPGAHG